MVLSSARSLSWSAGECGGNEALPKKKITAIKYEEELRVVKKIILLQ